MARSWLPLWFWLGAAGCDRALGLDRGPEPCGDASFASAAAMDVVEAELFSLSWDRDRLVYANHGSLYETSLPLGAPSSIEFSVYPPLALALAPEGDAMFVTAAIDPPLLEVAVRSDAGWVRDAFVPAGTTAGTPSAAEFGARRVLVRLRWGEPEVQEYEARDNQWQPVGEVHAIGGGEAANLTPSGLDLVYADATGDAPAVFVAHRASTDAWFGAPVAILAGAHRSPQLLDRCDALYTLDAGMVRRYDR